MNQVRNFPLVFNGTKLKQTIQGFGEKINMVFELIFRFIYLLLNKTFLKGIIFSQFENNNRIFEINKLSSGLIYKTNVSSCKRFKNSSTKYCKFIKKNLKKIFFSFVLLIILIELIALRIPPPFQFNNKNRQMSNLHQLN